MRTEKPKPDLQSGLVEMKREVFEAFHPDDLLLLDYAEARLDAARAEAVVDHLAWCPVCTRLVLDFRTMNGAAGDETREDTLPHVSDEALDAGWQQVLRASGDAPSARVVPFYRRLAFAYGLAAVFLIGALLLPMSADSTFDPAAFNDRLRALPAPATLLDLSQLTRAEPASVNLPGRVLNLKLKVDGTLEYGALEVVVTGEAVPGGLDRMPVYVDSYGTVDFTYAVPAQSGVLALTLFERRDSGDRKVAHYRVTYTVAP